MSTYFRHYSTHPSLAFIVCDIWWRRDYIDDFTWPDTMKNSKVVATSFLINLFTYSERLNRLFTHSLTHSLTHMRYPSFQAGGVDAKYLQSSQSVAASRRAAQIRKVHQEREQHRLEDLMRIQTQTQALHALVVAREENSCIYNMFCILKTV